MEEYMHETQYNFYFSVFKIKILMQYIMQKYNKNPFKFIIFSISLHINS